jgi:predicted Zn-dependent protease
MKICKKTIVTITALGLMSAGCAENSQFSQLGANILSQTGLVTSSQATSFFSAGSKLSKAAQGLSDEQEYYLGRGVSAMVFAKYHPAKTSGGNTYMTTIAQTLASYSDRPETFGGYHVAVLDTPEINAMSAPGGFIFISRGFVNKIHDEDELAAVIAHEIGHVARRHGVAAISNANLTQALAIIGNEAAASSGNATVAQLDSLFHDSVNSIFDTLLTKGYSRSQEYEADEYAAHLLTAAGYNPGALGSVLKTLESSATKQDAGWFKTHPSPEKRLSELGKLVSATQPTKTQIARTSRFKNSVGFSSHA